MDNERSHINPLVPADLIRRYFAGELDDAAMHALEKQALANPFLAEALEGYAAHAADQTAPLADLEARLARRVASGEEDIPALAAPAPATPVVKLRRFDYRWAAAAAVLLLLAVGGYEWLHSGPEKTPIAQQLPPAAQRQAATSDTAAQQTITPPAAPDSPAQAAPAANTLVSAPPAAMNRPEKKSTPRPPALATRSKAAPATTPAPSPAITTHSNAVPLSARVATPPAREPATHTADALAPAVPGQQLNQAQQGAGDQFKNVQDTVAVTGYAARKMQQATALPAGDSGRILSLKEEPANAHTPSIQGVVVDENGQPLPGVVVRFKGSPNAVQTNLDGYFSLPGASTDSARKVEMQFIGYDKVDTKLYASLHANRYKLRTSSKAQGETVIVASGATRLNEAPYQAPSPATGYDSLHRYLDDHLQNVGAPYGRLRIIFTVTPTGKLENFKVLNGVSDFVDRQVIELLKEGPAWKPASDYRPAKVKLAVKVPGPKK
ncbi:MAG TPA: carboxypeptidase-like regulatory domain-containing protein [Chitinophaga sp.]